MQSVSTVSESDWIKGISLSILASILGAASKLAIRKSWLLQKSIASGVEYDDHAPEEASEDGEDSQSAALMLELPSQDAVSPLLLPSEVTLMSDPCDQKRKLWPAYALRFSGMMGMTIFNPLCGVLAMNYASPSILAPFSGLTLVWIIVLSDVLIQERATPGQVAAAALIISGEIIVSVFGDHTNDANVTVQHVRDSYFYPPFLLFLVALFLWLAQMARWMNRGSPALKRFAWGVAGGSVTGLQNFLKDSLIVLKATDGGGGGNNQHHHHLPWWFFLLVTLAVMSAFTGLLLLTACMKRYDVTFSSAMFVGSFIVSTSIMSVAHYATFENLQSVSSYVMYPAGLVVLMSGVVLLAQEAEDANVVVVPIDVASDDFDPTLRVSLLSPPEPISLAIEMDQD